MLELGSVREHLLDHVNLLELRFTYASQYESLKSAHSAPALVFIDRVSASPLDSNMKVAPEKFKKNKKQTFDPTPISQTLPREAIPQTLLIAQNSNDVSRAAQIKPNRQECKPSPLKAKRNTKKDER